MILTRPDPLLRLLDWPIGLSDLEPYYDKAEDPLAPADRAQQDVFGPDVIAHADVCAW